MPRKKYINLKRATEEIVIEEVPAAYVQHMQFPSHSSATSPFFSQNCAETSSSIHNLSPDCYGLKETDACTKEKGMKFMKIKPTEEAVIDEKELPVQHKQPSSSDKVVSWSSYVPMRTNNDLDCNASTQAQISSRQLLNSQSNSVPPPGGNKFFLEKSSHGKSVIRLIKEQPNSLQVSVGPNNFSPAKNQTVQAQEKRIGKSNPESSQGNQIFFLQKSSQGRSIIRLLKQEPIALHEISVGPFFNHFKPTKEQVEREQEQKFANRLSDASQRRCKFVREQWKAENNAIRKAILQEVLISSPSLISVCSQQSPSKFSST